MNVLINEKNNRKQGTASMEKSMSEIDHSFTTLQLSPEKIREVLLSLRRLAAAMAKAQTNTAFQVMAGELCFTAGLYEDARILFEKALTEARYCSDASNNLGVIQLIEGNSGKADSFFKKALELDATNNEAEKNLNILQGHADSFLPDNTHSHNENVELSAMKGYWDACARDNAMRHIACDDWQSEEVFHLCGERDLESLLSNIDKSILLRDNCRALEIGCGIGRLIKPFATAYPDLRVYGVDVSDEMIRRGRERLADYGNAELHATNGRDLSIFDDNSMDLVYSYIVFQHIPRKHVYHYFKEISRILVSGGIVVFQLPVVEQGMPAQDPPDADFRTIRQYSQEEVKSVCNENGLSLEKVTQMATLEKYCPHAWFTARKG